MTIYSLQNNRGLTLTELVIATILMAIIMLGVLSTDYAVRNMDKTTQKGTLTAMQVATAVLRISKDLEQAVGDATNHGILTSSAGGSYAVCSRHDNNDPNKYTDDGWDCYIVATGDTALYHCLPTNTTLTKIQANESVSCILDSQGPIHKIIDLSKRDFFNIDPNLNNIEITIQSRPDVTAPADALDNPQYEMTMRVTPLAHSF